MKEWQEVIQQEERRKTLGKQNTVAVENPSLEGSKSKAASIRTGSLSSSWGSKQSLKGKKKERLYETDISEDDDVEMGKHDSGEVVKDSKPPVSSPNAEEPSAVSAQENPLTSGSRSSLLSAGEKGKVSRSPKQEKALKSGSRTSFKALLGVKSPEEREKQKVEKQNKSTWSKREKIAYFEEKADSK